MKIEHILYPIDFSDNTLTLTSDVEWLANHYKAQVTLLNVFEVPTRWYGAPMMLTCETFTAYAEAEKERPKHYTLALPENSIHRISRDGNAAWNIAQWAKDHQVDLIVMGTHGNSGFPRLLLGSVAMKVLHEVECPVWTHSALMGAGRLPKSGISRIVCSIELSQEAVPLLRFTQELADEFGATASLVHSVPAIESWPARYFDFDLHRSVMKLDEEEITKLQIEAGTNFPVRITDKFIAEDVAEVAIEQKADLIVLGRGVVQETFGTWRSHLYEIIRRAPCPVLSYPVQKHELGRTAHRTDTLAEQPVG